MSYQVPKLSIDVKLVLSDGSKLEGMVFVSENMLSYTGTPRFEDFLNRNEERFFPFTTQNEGVVLINKGRLIYLHSSEEDSDILRERLMLKPKQVQLRFSNGDEIEGVVYSNLPQDTARVSDFFNQKEKFLPLYLAEGKVIVNTDMVVSIKD